MSKTITERRITYEYGPNGADYTGVFGGEYSWDQLESMIRDDRWGSSYTVIGREERTVVIGDWVRV